MENRVSAFIEQVRQSISNRMYQGQLRYENDLKTLQKYVELAREIGDGLLLGKLHLTMAMAHEFAGYFPESIQFYEQAYHIFARENDIPQMAKARNNLAELHRLAGRLEVALKFYNEAYLLIKECPDKSLLPLIVSNIGLTWLAMGDYLYAEEHFLEVIRLIIKEGIHNTDALMEAHRGLGEVYLGLKSFAEAWQNVRLALELAIKMEDKITEAEVNLLCARLAEADPDSSETPEYYYQESRRHLTSENAPTVLSRSFMEESQYCQRIGNVERAKALAQQALSFTHQNIDAVSANGQPLNA